MLHVMCNARVGEALRNEIEQANPTWPVITDAEARRMPYLQAVIKEGLRMFPPVAGLMAKEVPKGGDTFKGTFFPEGTRIGYCAWGVVRWPEVWGSDAHEFRPERWLEASPEKLREMDGTVELVFGYGRWQCLGRNVAFIELNKVFVEVSCPEATRVENLLTIDGRNNSSCGGTICVLSIPPSRGNRTTLAYSCSPISGSRRTGGPTRRLCRSRRGLSMRTGHP